MTTATKDIAVPTAVERQRSVTYIPDDKPVNHGLPNPPDNRRPAWAMAEPPERDAAMVGLFPEDCARAERFWGWLMERRRTAAERAQRGYVFLHKQERLDKEDRALYLALLRYVRWCEWAWWELTTWYAPAGLISRPTTLWLPLPTFPGIDGEVSVVRELNGLPGCVLLEDVLAATHEWAWNAGYLTDIDEEETT